jgi:hypothetical protein
VPGGVSYPYIAVMMSEPEYLAYAVLEDIESQIEEHQQTFRGASRAYEEH